MRRRLPPLSSLVAFEAVAELGSFSRAGDALALTHSAISHQVKLLEEHLGVRLLERLPRKVVLTSEGSIYLAEVRSALKALEGAESVLKDYTGSRPLRISVLPSFAGNLLVPELLPFLERHPNIKVELDATAGIENDEQADIDVFIRYGKGDWPGFESIELLKVQLFPVCSPAYVQKRGPFKELSDLSRAVLLRHTKEPWETWLDAAAARLPGAATPVLPAGPLFTDARLMLDAACDGHGIALARSALAAADLREGRLVQLLDLQVDSPLSYRAYMRPGTGSRPPIGIFLDWLLTICSRVRP